jgi:amidophosphoribosyltransferase
MALQHRGQESAGMSVSDGSAILTVKDMGLVPNVFDDYQLAALVGHLAIGQTRYSTTGSSSYRNAQPVYRDVGGAEFALGHNGNLTNTAALASEAGMLPGVGAASDSDLVAELLSDALLAGGAERSDGRDLEHALLEVLPRLEGGVLPRAPRPRAPRGRPRPERLPSPVPRHARRRAGSSPPRAPPSTPSGPASCGRSSRARSS